MTMPAFNRRPIARLGAALLVTTALAQAAPAAEISRKGADDIVNALTHYLPKDMVDTGFIKVEPATNRYVLSVDIQPLIDKAKMADFSITGLKPFVQFLTPQDDGLWRIEAGDSLAVSGTFGKDAGKTDFAYTIGRYSGDSLFDPSISYVKSSSTKLEGIEISTTTPTETVNMSIENADQTIATTKVDDKLVTMVSKGTLNNFSQSVTGTPDDFSFTAGSLGVDVNLDKFNIVAFRDLVVFVLDRIGQDKLTQADADALKPLLKANIPMAEMLKETITVNNLAVTAQGMTVKADRVSYNIDFNGIRRDSQVGIDFSAGKLVIPEGLLPAGSEEALPDEWGVGFAITGLNLADAANYFIDKADFTKDEVLTPAEDAEVSKIVLPDGNLNIVFRNVFAKSKNYDITMTGTMSGKMEGDKYLADVVIKAKNLDGTIAFLQSKASTIPEFGQAAFGAQMMKGFAKQEADGSFTWNVVVDETGKVKINGQDMPQ